MYSTVQTSNMTLADLAIPVEGFRSGWMERLLRTYELANKEERGCIKTTLYILRAEETPPAYLRSEPIARFQYQLRRVVFLMESMDAKSEEAP